MYTCVCIRIYIDFLIDHWHLTIEPKVDRNRSVFFTICVEWTDNVLIHKSELNWNDRNWWHFFVYSSEANAHKRFSLAQRHFKSRTVKMWNGFNLIELKRCFNWPIPISLSLDTLVCSSSMCHATSSSSRMTQALRMYTFVTKLARFGTA